MGLIVYSVIFSSMIVSWILFFIINIKTVRRLRKNPITKNELGFHLFWGWYALNISETLLFSKEWTIRRRNSSNGYMFANYDLVHQYTTPFEKVICKLCIILSLFSVLGLLTIEILSYFGFDILDY